MKITRYGICLERLKHEHIEMVRKWRNDPKISRFMFYKGEITPEMQEEWFAGINNDSNFFFLIHYRNEPVGLINISSVDWVEKTAYSGLFIYEEKFWGTDIPVMASLAVLDVFFILFKIQTVYAKVKGTNQGAHNYNSALGFTKTKKIELGQGDEYVLHKEIYLLRSREIRNAALRLKGNKTVFQVSPDEVASIRLLDKYLKTDNKSAAELLEPELISSYK